jgi:hypothetical protein
LGRFPRTRTRCFSLVFALRVSVMVSLTTAVRRRRRPVRRPRQTSFAERTSPGNGIAASRLRLSGFIRRPAART